eukprot:9481069-Pyramimonas_sp.AAC.1
MHDSISVVEPRESRTTTPPNTIQRQMHSLDGPSRALPSDSFIHGGSAPHLTYFLYVVVRGGGGSDGSPNDARPVQRWRNSRPPDRVPQER